MEICYVLASGSVVNHPTTSRDESKKRQQGMKISKKLLYYGKISPKVK